MCCRYDQFKRRTGLFRCQNQPLSPPAQAFLKGLKNLGTKKMRFQGMGALMAEMLAEEKR
jgi:hypothetical protein